MTRRRQLSRELIVRTAARLVDAGSPLTMVRLGEALGVDPSAVYRHFANRSELLHAVGDHALSSVTRRLPSDDWRSRIVELCVRLRRANLAQPHLAELVRAGPPLQPNEFAITECLLDALRQAGLVTHRAASAYHAIIELTIGSAVLDAAVHTQPSAVRQSMYRRWRDAYRSLDPALHPASVAAADSLYRGSSEQRFVEALNLLLDGIVHTVDGEVPVRPTS